jgi:hypothetical protein
MALRKRVNRKVIAPPSHQGLLNDSLSQSIQGHSVGLDKNAQTNSIGGYLPITL